LALVILWTGCAFDIKSPLAAVPSVDLSPTPPMDDKRHQHILKRVHQKG
jgi:hypothetical protein